MSLSCKKKSAFQEFWKKKNTVALPLKHANMHFCVFSVVLATDVWNRVGIRIPVFPGNSRQNLLLFSEKNTHRNLGFLACVCFILYLLTCYNLSCHLWCLWRTRDVRFLTLAFKVGNKYPLNSTKTLEKHYFKDKHGEEKSIPLLSFHNPWASWYGWW